MPFIIFLMDDFLFVNSEQCDPEFFFFLVHLKRTEFGGECVVSCYHSVIFRSYLQEYLEKIIISYTECVRVCVLNFQIL